MTKLTKPVRRITDSTIRDCGKVRNLVITIYTNGTLGLRPSKTRREEIVTLEACYGLGVRQRVAAERAEKLAKKKAGRSRR